MTPTRLFETIDGVRVEMGATSCCGCGHPMAWPKNSTESPYCTECELRDARAEIERLRAEITRLNEWMGRGVLSHSRQPRSNGHGLAGQPPKPVGLQALEVRLGGSRDWFLPWAVGLCCGVGALGAFVVLS